jgi:hypothetical protein
MRVYGHVPTHEEDGNLYSNPILPPAHAHQPRSFPSLNRPHGDPVLSEDCTDDYAEPQQLVTAAATAGQYRPPAASASYSENIYAQAFPPPAGTATRSSNPALQKKTTTNHYARPQLTLPSPPLSGRTVDPSLPDDGQPFLAYSPPRRFSPPSPRRQRLSPPRTLNLQSVYGTASRRGGGGSSKTANVPVVATYSTSQPDIYSPLMAVRRPEAVSLLSPSQSSLSSVDRFYTRPLEPAPVYSKVSKRSPAAAAVGTGGGITGRARSHSASQPDHNKERGDAHLLCSHRRLNIGVRTPTAVRSHWLRPGNTPHPPAFGLIYKGAKIDDSFYHPLIP